MGLKVNSDDDEDPVYRRPMPPRSARDTVEQWLEWMNQKLVTANSEHPDENPGNPEEKEKYEPCSIFKVPERIRHWDEEAYIPAVASIGPLNHNYSNFFPSPAEPGTDAQSQRYKEQCVWHLLSRHGSQEPAANQLLTNCLLELKEQDARVRSCYSHDLPPLDAQELASIMLFDGCFIICLMLKRHAKKEDRDKEVKDPTMAGAFTFDVVLYDLLKLENQIPFFIIKLLFGLLKPCEDDLVDLALDLFKGIHPEESKSFREEEKKSPGNYHHLLHLFYSSRIPLIPLQKPAESASTPGHICCLIDCIKFEQEEEETAALQGSTSAPKWIPSATELNRAGVKFKRKTLQQGESFLNIAFKSRKKKITPFPCLLKLCLMFRSGRMEIPALQIYDHSGPLFRNLIVFEQCYRDTKMYFTIYALFMDCLIDQAEDVQLLHLEGILEYRLSSDQAVAELFNYLGSHIHFDWRKNYLAHQIEEVNNFYDSKWHKWLAGLRRDYLGNPWAIISVLAAIFLLLLTIEQAVFSALSYFHSP